MFRPLRLLVLCLVAFVAGMLFERRAQSEACESAGGSLSGRICERGAHD